ncbi:LysR substrate-binding domain-containing protein [Streptomyces sp. NPDC047525]|uniref:LysR substrate-binding domain-containing protein n=1 Tax=Streptomyces sp. NPDC047525 TaxID=3155264 RepID=UPI0034085233
MRHTAEEFTGLLRGQIALGLVSGAATHEFDVVSVLADFHDDHPDVEIALTEDSSDRMLAAVRAGELDIALLGLTDEEPPPGISLRMVIDEPLVAVVLPGDALLAPEGRTTVPLAALRDRPLISLPRGTGVRRAACSTVPARRPASGPASPSRRPPRRSWRTDGPTSPAARVLLGRLRTALG